MSPRPRPDVVSAVIRDNDRLLLVEQQGPADAEPHWMLPGGRVEPGEDPRAALAREVAEETGLLVARASIAFEVEIDVPGTPAPIRVVTYACDVAGVVGPADPDALIIGAAWIPVEEALRRLAAVAWYECAPLGRWLANEAPAGARYYLPLPRPTDSDAQSSSDLDPAGERSSPVGLERIDA